MTPKEKAKELIYKFYRIIPLDKMSIDFDVAKKCALISVAEILKTNPYQWDGEDLNSTIDYWEEVKKEIEAL